MVDQAVVGVFGLTLGRGGLSAYLKHDNDTDDYSDTWSLLDDNGRYRVFAPDPRACTSGLARAEALRHPLRLQPSRLLS